MAWTEALARAAAGQFAEAFEKLDTLRSDNRFARPETIYSLLRTTTPDVDFARYLLSRLDHAATLPADETNRLAARLLEMGFAQEAGDLLGHGAEREAGRERRILRAETALAMKRPRQAEAEVLGLSGIDVDTLRARARTMAGDHAVAASVYSALDAQTESRRAAFLAGDWDRLAKSSDPLLAQIARGKLSVPSTQNEEDGVLTRNRRLLDQSSNSRQMLDELLARYALDDTLADGPRAP
jgi:cell division septum initiation protein DivIVA